MKTIKRLSALTLILIAMVSCQNSNATHQESNQDSPTKTASSGDLKVKKGDHVPSGLVCMVNDVYMGKEQIAVHVGEKTYYGCCDMCKERIPKDAVIRKAIDPHTMHEVDKASAYIVMIGDNGEVAYFESKATYDDFLEKNK